MIDGSCIIIDDDIDQVELLSEGLKLKKEKEQSQFSRSQTKDIVII